MSLKRLYGLILIVVLIVVSIFSFIRTQNRSPLQERSEAATAEAIALAENEYEFINQIYLKYIANRDASQLTQTYNNMYDYRNLCSMGTINAIAKGGELTPNDPFSEYFRNKYNSKEFLDILDLQKKRGGWHVRSAAGFDCLVAANAMRHTLGDKKNTIMNDLATFTRGIESSLIDESQKNGYGNTIVDYYKAVAAINIGDSQAEEALAVASLFEAASKFMPSSGAGAISNDERNRWHNTAKDLAKWAVTKGCDTCSIRNSMWLINNHQYSPNPNYTLSLLTAYSEIAMASNQTGKSMPTDIFDSTVIQNLNNIGNDLSNYLSPSFGFKGSYKIIDNNGNEQTTFNYENTRYTFTGQSVSTSLATDSIDSMNQYVIPNTNTLKSYVYKDDKMWAYTCDTNNSNCKADYQTTVNAWLSGVKRKSNDGWNSLPNSVDSVVQWFKDDTTLYTYAYSGNNVWHFICTNVGRAGTECTAESKNSLSSHKSTSLWGATRENLDAVSEFVQPGTNNLKGYIFKGNRMYAYNCDRNNYPSSCTIFLENSLSDLWSGVSNTLGSSWNPPQDKFDSAHQYYNQSGALITTVANGSRIWIYTCQGSCSSTATKTLGEYFQPIQYKFKWPQFDQDNVQKLVGVSDWGMDGTFQNSAFSTLYLINSQNHSKYSQLQQEQIKRGRNSSTLPLPSEYSNDQWNYNALTTTRNAGGLYAMSDGFDNPQPVDRKINAHLWLNVLAGKNHSMAYLALTDKKILGSFNEPLPTNTPQHTITIGPTTINTPGPTNTIAPTVTTAPTTGPTTTGGTDQCPRKPEGDADCNGIIDYIDFVCWRGELIGSKPTNCKSADFNGSGGKPDSQDYTQWFTTLKREQQL